MKKRSLKTLSLKLLALLLSKPSGTSYYAEIGSAGGIVTITSIGKNAKNGFLSTNKGRELLL